MVSKLTPAKIEEYLATSEKTKSAQRRGKSAEDACREHLKALKQAHPEFDFQRLYDAHSAGGRFPAQIADFLVFRGGDNGTKHGAIEVKEIASGERLPAKNFPSKI